MIEQVSYNSCIACVLTEVINQLKINVYEKKHLTLVVVPELTVHCEQVEVYTKLNPSLFFAFLPTSTNYNYNPLQK